MRTDAQAEIDAAYERWSKAPTDTLGLYAARDPIAPNELPVWLQRYPRSQRTNDTNEGRIRRILDVEIDGVSLRDWPLRELGRRHIHELVDQLLTGKGLATGGVQGILRVLSALFEDAITDELADVNPVKGVRVRTNDLRVKKPGRKPKVWSFDEMHAFAHTARTASWTDRTGRYRRSGIRLPTSRHPELADLAEAMVRTFCDTGLRLGEVIGLERGDFDGQVFRPRGNAHDGVFTKGDTETKGHVREAPCPPGLAAIIARMPTRIDTPLLFPTPNGCLWWERNFYRSIWEPTVDATGIVCRPHEFRHSYLTHLRAAGIDDADLAEIAGHSVDTLLGTYTHALRRSYDRIRDVIG